MLRLACFAPALFAAVACTAPPHPGNLEAELRERIAPFRGTVGVHVRHLCTGETANIAADEPFPTASLIKVPLLAALLAKVQRGELDYHQELVYEAKRRYPGDDLLAAFADGQKLTLDKLVLLMITMSDNTAALWCQELAGTGTAVNEWLAANGFATTRVNSRTPGREAAQQQWGWGVTTPREMCELLVRVRDRRLVDAAVSEEAARCLGRIYWDSEALSAMPPHVHTLSKQGAVDRSRSEVVLVHAPHGDYVFAVITKEQRDTSWGHDNEGFVLLREIAALLWHHFEPDAPYAPPAGAQRFW